MIICFPFFIIKGKETLFRFARNPAVSFLPRNATPPFIRPASRRRFQSIDQLPTGTKEIVFVGGHTLPMQLLQKQKKDGLLDQYRHAGINVRLFVARSFLDDLMPDYHEETWGQTLLGFTADGEFIGQPYFDAKQLHLDPDRLLTLQEVKGIRRMVLQQLQQYDIDYYEGNIESFTRLPDKQFELILDSQKVTIDRSAFFWVWYSEPKDYVIGKGSIIGKKPIPSATKLYSLPEHEVPQQIAVIGTGPTAVWVAKHFTKWGKMIFILSRKDNPQFPKLPSNSDFDMGHAIATEQVIIVNLDRVELKQGAQPGQCSFISRKTKKVLVENVFLYAAIGLARNGLDQSKIRWSDIPAHQSVMSQSFDIEENCYGNFIAPQNNAPGSSLQSTVSLELIIEQRFQKPTPFRPYSYYFDEHKKLLQTIFKQQGLVLSRLFFERLAARIQLHHNPGTKEQALQLYMEIYELEEYAELHRQHFKDYNQPLVEQIFADPIGLCYAQPEQQVVSSERLLCSKEVKKP